MLYFNQHAEKLFQQLHSTKPKKAGILSTAKALITKIISAFLIALFFVFVGTDSVADVVNTPYFRTDLIVSFILGFLLLHYVQQLSFRLDKKYSWHRQFQKRIVKQLLLGLLVPALMLAAVVSIYFFAVMNYEAADVRFFYNEFPMCVVVIAALNIFYAAWFFSEENKLQEAEMSQLQQQVFTLQQKGLQVASVFSNGQNAMLKNTSEDEEVSGLQKLKTLVAVSGNKNVPIPTLQIAYIIKEGNFTKLITFQSNFYLLTHTLDELMNFLDDALFFRANRQVIINMNACHYFTNEENGKLALYLTPEWEEEVIISQKRASLFKDWLNG